MFCSRFGPIPIFLPRCHTEWPFGLCFRLSCTMAHVSRPFPFRHELFAPGLNVVPCVGTLYNLFHRIQVFWSDPTFLPRGHTEWPFGLCSRLPCPMAHVSQPFPLRHEPFAPGWTWFQVWVLCITFPTEFWYFGPIPHFCQGVILNGRSAYVFASRALWHTFLDRFHSDMNRLHRVERGSLCGCRV